MSRNSALDPAFDSLAAHPYLWTFAACLLCEPFFFGQDWNVASYALSAGTIAAIAITIVFGLYMLRANGPSLAEIGIFVLSAALAASFLARQYSRMWIESYLDFAAPWLIVVTALFVAAAAVMRKWRAGSKEHSRQINVLMIIALGFFLKILYVILTGAEVRQHDVHEFGGDIGHAAYIEYLLYNRALPNFDVTQVWQFYHPPLHHTISALWIYFNEYVFLVGPEAAIESLQTLTLFYSMCIIITSYRILRHFRLEGWALYIPLILISFHPAFILFSGSINNDVLSVAFILGAVWCTLKWYENQTMSWILKIALCVGLGMMTKLAAAIVAPSIALVFLVALYKRVKAKTGRRQLLVQFVCFCLVCIPLGTWFGIRNYVGWHTPFAFVPKMSTDHPQYVGTMSFIERVTDLSAPQFINHYIQFEPYAQGVYEFNPVVALMKTAVFGEFKILSASTVWPVQAADAALYMMFWLNTAIACFALIAMIIVCFRKSTVQKTAALFLASFVVIMLVSYFKMTIDYAHTSTMNFRYITPTAIIGAIFIGMFLKSSGKRTAGGKIVLSVVGSAALLFAVLSEFIYSAIV